MRDFVRSVAAAGAARAMPDVAIIDTPPHLPDLAKRRSAWLGGNAVLERPHLPADSDGATEGLDIGRRFAGALPADREPSRAGNAARSYRLERAP